jgi:hypothetical protein
MEKITVKQYAVREGITIQAVHKRLKNLSKYSDIISVEILAPNFFLLNVKIKLKG